MGAFKSVFTWAVLGCCLIGIRAKAEESAPPFPWAYIHTHLNTDICPNEAAAKNDYDDAINAAVLSQFTSPWDKDIQARPEYFGYSGDYENEKRSFETIEDLTEPERDDKSIRLGMFVDDSATIEIYECDEMGYPGSTPVRTFKVGGGAAWNPASYKMDDYVLSAGKKYKLKLQYQNDMHWTDGRAQSNRKLNDMDGVSVYRVWAKTADLDGDEPDGNGGFYRIDDPDDESPGICLAKGDTEANQTWLVVHNPGPDAGTIKLTWQNPGADKKLNVANHRDGIYMIDSSSVTIWPLRLPLQTMVKTSDGTWVVGDWDFTDSMEVSVTLSNASGHQDRVKLTIRNADLDVDTDRNGHVDSARDEAGEETWNIERGAFVPPREDHWPTPMDGLGKLIVRSPGIKQPENWSMRLKAINQETKIHLCLCDVNGDKVRFDADGIAAIQGWPEKDEEFYAFVVRTRKFYDGNPDLLKLSLEILDEAGTVKFSDTVQFKAAPVILSSECSAAEKVYSMVLDIAGVTLLDASVANKPWLQDMVKFCKVQKEMENHNTVAVTLGHEFDLKLSDVLCDIEKTPSCIWPAEGDGGAMMATPPLPDAPFGKIMLGNKNLNSEPYWTSQGVQPVVNISTDWLAVGHVDEIMMWIGSKKLLLADPWKAADLLHREIVTGNGAKTMWFGFKNDDSRVRTINSVVIAPRAGNGYKKDALPVALPESQEPAIVSFTDNVFEISDLLRVDDEILCVTNVSDDGKTVTLARAWGGNPADPYDKARPVAAHAAGAVIYAYSSVMISNLPIGMDYKSSIYIKIHEAMLNLSDALGSYNSEVDVVSMPILFDWYEPNDGSNPGWLAATSDVVNGLLHTDGKFYRPLTGCATFEVYVNQKIPNNVAMDTWAAHCGAGDIHCLTAAIRKLPVVEAWWKKLPNWR